MKRKIIPVLLCGTCILCLSGCSNSTQKNTEIFCSYSNGENDYSITLTGNNQSTTIKGYESFSSPFIGSKLCEAAKTIVNYYDGTISCKEGSRYTISYTYQRDTDINEIVEEYEKDEYTCE